MLKMTGKDSASKTKPLPGEQATSAADLTARIVFEAPVTVRWSRHDQNDRWAVPVVPPAPQTWLPKSSLRRPSLCAGAGTIERTLECGCCGQHGSQRLLS